VGRCRIVEGGGDLADMMDEMRDQDAGYPRALRETHRSAALS
jgi:hypothetical protein